MKTHPDRKLILGNAIVWAAMMIALSLLFAKSEAADTLILLLVAGWFASHSMMTDLRAETRREWVCLIRWIKGATR